MIIHFLFNKLSGLCAAFWRERLFRRITFNAATLLTGTAVGQFLSLIAFSLTARALGQEQLGIMALIQAYALTVETLATFQAWQATTRYGAKALEELNERAFRAIVKLCLVLDVSTAVGGAAIGSVAVYLFGGHFGLSPVFVLMTTVYSVGLAFRLSGTTNACLRLFGEFRQLALSALVSPIVRLSATAVFFILGSRKTWVYLLIWMAGDIISQVVQFFVGWREMAKRGFGVISVLRSPLKGIFREQPGLGKFVLSTNISSSLRYGVKEADIFVVGALLGPAATGIYKVAREVARIPAALVGPLQEALYPEAARLWSTHKARAFRNVIIRTNVISGSIGLLFWLGTVAFGRFFLRSTVGDNFVQAYAILIIYMLSVWIFTLGVAFLPAMLSVGRAHYVLWIYVISIVGYFSILLPLTTYGGLGGVAVAQLGFQLLWYGGSLWSLRGPILQGMARGVLPR